MNLLVRDIKDCPVFHYDYELNDEVSHEKHARVSLWYLKKLIFEKKVGYFLLVKGSDVQLLLQKISKSKKSQKKT